MRAGVSKSDFQVGQMQQLAGGTIQEKKAWMMTRQEMEAEELRQKLDFLDCRSSLRHIFPECVAKGSRL